MVFLIAVRSLVGNPENCSPVCGFFPLSHVTISLSRPSRRQCEQLVELSRFAAGMLSPHYEIDARHVFFHDCTLRAAILKSAFGATHCI
jgi:hypothetical protein